MKQIIIILNFTLLSISGFSQTNTNNDTIIKFKSFDEILSESDIIDNQTFDLKFLIRSLPDNGWYLKLNKNGTYEYIYWSGFSDSDGTILEKGQYKISKNKIKLRADKKRSKLRRIKFYLVTSQTTMLSSYIITHHCVEKNSKTYCLYWR